MALQQVAPEYTIGQRRNMLAAGDQQSTTLSETPNYNIVNQRAQAIAKKSTDEWGRARRRNGLMKNEINQGEFQQPIGVRLPFDCLSATDTQQQVRLNQRNRQSHDPARQTNATRTLCEGQYQRKPRTRTTSPCT